MATIGFIGLGNMGAPMAANLVKAGHRVNGYDVNAKVVQVLAAAGVQAADSAAEATRGADVVITMLPAGEHVRDVWLHQGGLIEVVKGSAPLLIDCSTIDVESARVVTEAARVAGLEMLDAPVSGGVGGATAATLTFMVGGSETAFARGLPVLRRWARTSCMPAVQGQGRRRKIVQQHDARHQHGRRVRRFFARAEVGLDWDKLFQIASTSSGQSWALSSYCPAPGPVPAAPSNRDYAAGFTAALMLKDVKLSQAAADATGSPTPLAAHAMSFYQAVVDAGDGGKDFSVVFRRLANLTRQGQA